MYGSDLWNVFLEGPFDALLEGHGTGGAAYACSEEPDTDHTLGSDAYQLDVAIILLYRGPDEVQDLLDVFAHRPGIGPARNLRSVGRAGSGIVWHDLVRRRRWLSNSLSGN